MTAENILKSDVLDILFEDRNKLYGAYELRRSYRRRLIRAVGGMTLIVALFSASYLFGSRQNDTSGRIQSKDSNVIISLTPPEKQKEPTKPKPPAATVVKAASVKDFVPVIKPDVEVPKTEVPDVKQIDTSAIGSETKAGDALAAGDNRTADPGPAGGETGGTGTQPAPEPPLPAGPIDMNMADEMPQYPGGTQALVRYMVNNLTSELEPGVKYVIKAQFVINDEGKVSEAVIISSDDALLNGQVLKALRKMKQWKPGRLHGHNVAVRFVMPVTFMGGDE